MRTRWRTSLWVLACFVWVWVSGCRGGTGDSEAARDYPAGSPKLMEQAAGGMGGEAPAARMADGSANGESPAASLTAMAASATDRYLIRTAEVTLETRDARKAADAMGAAARAMGGYVGDSTEEVDPLGVRSVVLQLRVPADRFDDLMAVIAKQGTVLHRHVGTQDVTEEYVDVDAKLRNLKRTEERLLSHLSRTGKLADTLAVERELARVRMEIEQLEGRMRYLKHTIAYSTVSVTCREKARPGPAVPPESYSTGEVASAAARSLVNFGRSLWSAVIWIAVWAPVWLPVGLVLTVIMRRGRRRGPAAGP